MLLGLLGLLKCIKGVCFSSWWDSQMFYFLSLQPFKFPQDCQLLEFASSPCIPRIPYLCHCRVAQKKIELSLSSDKQIHLRIPTDTSKGKKSKDCLSLGWMSHFSLGFTSFLFGWLPISSVASRSLNVFSIWEAVCSEAVFLLGCSHSLAPVLLLQRSGCCHGTCLRPGLGLPGLRANPALQLPLCRRSAPTVQLQPTQNLLVSNILSHPTPAKDKWRSSCWVQLPLKGGKGRGKNYTWSVLLRKSSFTHFLGHWHKLMKFVSQELSITKYPHNNRKENSDYVTTLLALRIKDIY